MVKLNDPKVIQMTSEQFAYYLGCIELSGERPDEKKWDGIKENFPSVFDKVTQDGPRHISVKKPPVYEAKAQ
jgi:hypothetical protein